MRHFHFKAKHHFKIKNAAHDTKLNQMPKNKYFTKQQQNQTMKQKYFANKKIKQSIK